MSAAGVRGTARLAGVLCVALILLTPARALARTPRAPRLPVQLRSAALYVPATGQTLYADHAAQPRPIASTTKMMTALVTLEHVSDLGTVFRYPDYHQAPDDSQIGLRPGDRMTVRDLLTAMMLPSADDAAEDLAQNVGHGSVARFVGWMNQAARKLGLRHTHFTTPIGLDTPGNYSTASDLARLAAYDLSHFPAFARTVRLAHATLATGPEREVSNLNLLVGEYPWVTGVKTGHTSGAGWVLVAAGERHGLRLVASALGVESDLGSDDDALALLDYGYARYAMRTPVRVHEAIARLRVADRPGVRVAVRAARSYRRVFARAEPVRLRRELPSQLRGPLPAGAIVGSVVVVGGGRTLRRIPLVLGRRLPAVSRLAIAARFVTRPWMLALLVVLGGLVLLAGLAVAGRRRGRGGPGGPVGRSRQRSSGRFGPGFGA